MYFRLTISLLLSLSNSVYATQDVTEAEDALPLLRSFISNATVSSDINALVQNGCVWSSESIWVGGGVEVNEKNQHEIGGGFSIYLKTRLNEQRELSYFFSVIAEKGKYTVSSLRYNNVPKMQAEC